MRKWIASLFRIIFFLLLIFLALGLLFPVIQCTESPKAPCVNDIGQLVVAVKSYRTDYGNYPGGLTNGRCETARANAKLLRILLGLDKVENPRQIGYIEIAPAKKRGDVYCSGLDPQGVWRDPWGNPYFLRVDMTGRQEIPNPYPGDPPSTIHRDVIAWSIGKDRRKGNPANKKTLQGSDDIVSWNR